MPTTSYFDLNLFSGSSDTLRTALGFFYEEVEASSPSVGTSTTWANEFDHTNLANPFLKNIWGQYDGFTHDISVNNPEAIVPNYTYMARLNGNAELILSDEQWKTILVGGTWGENEYAPIFNEEVFDNNSFVHTSLYDGIQKNVLNTLSPGLVSESEVFTITPRYNHHFKNYEEYVNRLDSELLIPNMYLLKMNNNFTWYNTGEGNNAALTQTLHNFVTRDGAIHEGTYLTNEQPLETYLNKYDTPNYDGFNSSIAQSILMFPLSASTEAAVKDQLQNMIFASDNAVSGIDPSSGVVGNTTFNPLTDVSEEKAFFPYYNQIEFTPDSVGAIGNAIEENDFGNKLLKTLKEIFTDQLDDFKAKKVEYAAWNSMYSASAEGVVHNRYEVNNAPLKEVDFLKMLGYIHNNYKSVTSNCCFVEEDGLAIKGVMDSTGTYRAYNTVNVLNVMRDTLSVVEEKFVDNWMNNNIWKTAGQETQGSQIHPLARLYQKAFYYSETLAYRIEKIGGSPTGDDITQPTLQNFWFFNSSDLTSFMYCDTQVKYGKDYTYKIYAYVVGAGHEYQCTDLAVTRQISYDEAEEKYCLEYYNPLTSESTPQLFGHDQSFNTYQGPAQVKSSQQYMADFKVNIAPSFKLFEIPMGSKTLKVLDNPPNQLNVIPRQFLDNSQRIGFSLRYETFLQQPFPLGVLARDEEYKTSYLHAWDLLEDNDLWLETVSQHKSIEVYRLDKLPHSLHDFEGSQIASIDLKKQDDSDRLSYVDFIDRIDINRKYYYLFRVLNEEGGYGHVSDILQAELVSDGGFKFATFNTLFPSSLGQSSYSNPSIPFKKIFQLEPNLSHLTFNTEDVDFADTALNQFQAVTQGVGVAEDSLWGKKFKVRLTSKKTGKKIDLNITYKLNGE